MSGRIKKTIRNSATALAGQMLNVLLNFIVRTVFIKTLGNSYLGINGLFSSILSLLSFAELGFGTAIVYALYKPLAEYDERCVSALMNFYEKVYKAIGVFILFAGLLITPFLTNIIGDVSQLPDDLPPIQYIYILYLINTASTYFFNYKRSLVIASQNGYIDTLNQLIFNFGKNLVQIITLLSLHSFVIYLFVQIIFTLAGNIAISHKADTLFPYLKENRKEKIGREDVRAICKNVLAMACHKLGSVIVSGTDSILITRFVGIASTGIYSNYMLITSTVRTIYLQVLSPITASLGNYIARESQDASYVYFRRILFMNAYIAVFCTVCLVGLSNPFIEIIWGKESLFPLELVMLIMTNFYLNCMRVTSEIYIDTIGLFWQIKWKSLIEAIVNLASSIFFGLTLDKGIYGVVLGTICSNILTNLWWEPYVVYKYYFRKGLHLYFIEYGKYLLMLIISIACVQAIDFRIDKTVGGFILRCIIFFAIPHAIFFFFFHKTDEYRYFIQIGKGTMMNRKKFRKSKKG